MSRGNSGGGQKPAQPISNVLPIAVRTYGIPEGKQADKVEFSSRGPSQWFLIFDTETTTDETQRPRIGAYQLRDGDELREQELFFDADALTSGDIRILEQYAAAKRIKLIPFREFIDKVFVPVAYHWQATTIGFNLPFDLSRLAEDHADARGKMRPGFSFETAPKGQKGPRIRIKHISRASIMEFSARGQRLPRGQRERKVDVPSRRPAFVDVSTIAHALLSKTFTLKDLAAFLETPHQKLGTDDHGKALTPEYLDYAIQDVQATWECFVELRKRLDEHKLTRTPIYRIYSEAGIGKGYLREIGVRPWREMQLDFPPELIGKIMGTYFGGRTEVHQRRVVMQVLYCDFTSMYPTVSTLMGLWPFVIAKRMNWRDATAETREFVKNATLADLQRRETWRRLHVIVQIEPDGDVLPVRAKYEYEPFSSTDTRKKHYTIGLNHLTSDQSLWYALPDVIASKLLNNGRAPKILKAIAFEAGEPQDGLQPVNIAGKADFRVDAYKDDLFKRLIELRMQTQEKQAKNALKLVANATGYGIFVEMNVNERSKSIAIHCYPATGPQFLKDMDQVEQPGEFFHPMIGTLIASAARLMLAITERLVADSGLTWTFCDTDSMAIAKPVGMADPEFFQKAQAVRDWFKPLNPYGVEVDLFKAEDENFRLVNGKLTKEFEPLYCFAISSKRYVLFNIDGKGDPVIRKASEHGLGHLLPPYTKAQAELPQPAFPVKDLVDEIGVKLWQHDFWHCIARAALAGNPDRPDFSRLPNFDLPAVTKYAATTPHLLDWFELYNRDKPYSKQVRPFNFMLMYQPDLLADWEDWRMANGIGSGDSDPELPCVIAPYDNDLAKAATRCFDRDTGKPVPANMLKSYLDALAQYHLRPEAKFLNADWLDSGLVQRRHVKVSDITYIGKEANRWEEQSYLGIDPEAEIAYGMPPEQRKKIIAKARKAAKTFGQHALVAASQISKNQISAILLGTAAPTDETLTKLIHGTAKLDRIVLAEKNSTEAIVRRVCDIIAKSSLRDVAQQIGVDAGNLGRMLSGERSIPKAVMTRMAKL